MFRYYITDLYNGNVKGTNDTQTAMNIAYCEDFFVVDVKLNAWIDSAHHVHCIQEIKDESISN